MSSIDKSNISNLEGKPESIDFGEQELNNLFKGLDEETRKKVLKYPTKEIQIEILKKLNDPELTELWNGLPEKQKKQLDSFGIRDRFLFLKDLLKKRKEKASKLSLFKPRSPDEPPPPPENLTPPPPPKVRLYPCLFPM